MTSDAAVTANGGISGIRVNPRILSLTKVGLGQGNRCIPRGTLQQPFWPDAFIPLARPTSLRVWFKYTLAASVFCAVCYSFFLWAGYQDVIGPALDDRYQQSPASIDTQACLD